jgi:hypothetical protein
LLEELPAARVGTHDLERVVIRLTKADGGEHRLDHMHSSLGQRRDADLAAAQRLEALVPRKADQSERQTVG